MSKPRRTIALGPPYDSGEVPLPPPEESVEDRLTRLERMLDRIEDTVHVLLALRIEARRTLGAQSDE